MGTLSPAFLSFTPQKNYLSFSAPINEVITITPFATGAQTYTAASVVGGFIIHTSNTAVNGTLPTATLLVPQIEGAQVGTAIFFTVRNNGTSTLTVAVGTGGTANSGDTLTVATVSQRAFMLVVTALPDQYGNGATYTLYSLGSLTY